MKILNIQLIFDSDIVAKLAIPQIKNQLKGMDNEAQGIHVLFGEEDK